MQWVRVRRRAWLAPSIVWNSTKAYVPPGSSHTDSTGSPLSAASSPRWRMVVAMNSPTCFSVSPVPCGRLPTYSRRSLRVACPTAPGGGIVDGAASTHWKPSQ
jgi:hypothetical protein